MVGGEKEKVSRPVWSLRPFSPEQEENQRLLETQFSLPPLIARLLIQRNLQTENQVQHFLHADLSHFPNPFLLPDMKKAVERLLKAFQKRERVLLFGDYDVDGITGTASLQAFFLELGLPTIALLPHRLNGGYGLSEKVLPQILSHKPDLVLTIDNGTKSYAEISHLKKNDIDVIVIDHHETPSADQPPPADALVNPKTPQSQFGERDICSAGLVFLLLMAFRSRLREAGISPLPNLKRYLDFACLGTIADVVPLVGTNRLFVKYGLKELEAATRPCFKSLATLTRTTSPLTATQVAFRWIPRLNAAGRLEDPQLALQFLLAENSEKADQFASELDELNRRRQRFEEAATREATELVERLYANRSGLVVASSEWHVGVVGIVAARLVDRFQKPSIVLSISEDGLARGSARSVAGFSLMPPLEKASDEMIRFGGHARAAGMTLKADRVEFFAQKFHEAVQEHGWENHSPSLWADASLPLEAVDFTLLKNLSLLEPYGEGNPEPRFSTSANLFDARLVGKSHLKVTVADGRFRFDGIGFDWGSYLEKASNNSFHDVIYFPAFQTWNGKESIQIQIKHLHPSQRGASR